MAELLARRGAVVLDADQLAHEALTEPGVVASVAARFGPGVLDADGRVDRRRLGEVVFADASRLRELEALVHPRVLAAIAGRLSALAVNAGTPRRVAVLDVPLAAEAGMMSTCELVVFVDASVEARRGRARERRGWAEGELERRELLQLPLTEKRAGAHFVVRNDRDVAEAEGDVERFWSEVIRPRIQVVG